MAVELSEFMPATARHLTDDEILHTRAEASRVCRCSISTLERWARLGTGPRITRLGGRTFYRLSDLRAFIASGSRAA